MQGKIEKICNKSQLYLASASASDLEPSFGDLDAFPGSLNPVPSFDPAFDLSAWIAFAFVAACNPAFFGLKHTNMFKTLSKNYLKLLPWP